MADEATEPTSELGGERVNVLNPYGRLVSIAAADAADAIGSGSYTEATAEDVRLWKRGEEYGGLAGTAEALVGGAAEEASLGLSTKLAVELGGEEMRQRILDVREESPTATMVGQVAGGVAGLGKLGAGAKGAGMLGRALKGAGSVVRAPARLATRAGEGASALVRTVAPSSKIAATAAQGAVEGAFFGAGSEVSDSALEGRGISGSKLLAGMGYGAAVGGAFGGAISGVGRLVGAGKRGLMAPFAARADAKAAARAKAGARATAGVTAEGSIEATIRQETADASPLIRKYIDALEAQGKVARVDAERILLSKTRRHRAVFQGDDATMAAERDIAASMDDLLTSTDKVRYAVTGVGKESQFAHLVKGRDPEVVRGAREYMAGMQKDVRAMIGKEMGGEFGGQGHLKGLLKRVDAIDRKLAKKGAIASNRDAFSALDEVKRAFDNRAKTFTSSYRRNGKGEFLTSHRRVKEIADGVREQLEREAVWGEGGRVQRVVNKHTTDKLGVQTDFNRRFVSEFGRDAHDPYSRGRVADPEKIARHVRDIGDPRKALDMRAYQEWVASNEEWLTTIRDNYQLGGAEKKAVEKALSATQKLRKAYGTASDVVGDVNALKRIQEIEGGFSPLTAAAAGTVALGPLGAALGGILGAASRPGATVVKIAHAERLAANLGVGSVAEAATKTAAHIEQLAGHAERKIGRAGSTLRRSKAVAMRAVTVTALEKREREKREKTIGLASSADVPALSAEAHANYAQAYPFNPAIVADMVATVERGAAYLQRVAPKPIRVPGQPPLPVSDEDLETFDRQRQVVNSPIDTITTAVEKGTIIPEQVKALDEVYPDEARELRDSYRQQLDEMSVGGEALPYQATMALEVLMREPLDYTSGRGYQMAMGPPEPPKKRPKPKTKPPEMADDYDRDAAIMEALA